jgi:hypothetical protein
MPVERLLMLAASVVAGLSLIKMMRQRQNHLMGLLRQHVSRQKEWAVKRDTAATMARKAALEKNPDRYAAALGELLASDGLNSADAPSTQAPAAVAENSSHA